MSHINNDYWVEQSGTCAAGLVTGRPQAPRLRSARLGIAELGASRGGDSASCLRWTGGRFFFSSCSLRFFFDFMFSCLFFLLLFLFVCFCLFDCVSCFCFFHWFSRFVS